MKTVSKIKTTFNVSINLPGSKLLTLRDSVLAALAIGTSEIRHPDECDDFWEMKTHCKSLEYL